MKLMTLSWKTRCRMFLDFCLWTVVSMNHETHILFNLAGLTKNVFLSLNTEKETFNR